MKALKTWWQMRSGEDETPFDGDTPAWLASLVFHMCLLVVAGLVGLTNYVPREGLVLAAPEIEKDIPVDLLEPEHNSDETQEIGSVSFESFDAPAQSLAQIVSEESIDPPPETETQPEGKIEAPEMPHIPTGLAFSQNVAIRGSSGVGTSGALGSLDRITEEIKQSLEQRPTLVVWMFDQSYSLNRQRKQVNARFRNIYKELGVIEEVNHKAFKQHKDKGDVPLLTTVMSFGRQYAYLTSAPTDDVALIVKTVDAIENDPTGDENVFRAIYDVAEKYKSMRKRRNVMFVVFTDEVGDDQQAGLEATIGLCRKYAIPVYVVGVPAPFGRDKTQVKWIDPDPKYDQRTQWGEVVQGPESCLLERINLSFGPDADDAPIASGFGPYGLTRLTYETGGIYFSVHPNRVLNRAVSKKETEVLASHLKYFFDPVVMQPYRPDYVSREEYEKMVRTNKARLALVKAAKQSSESSVAAMRNPRLRFPKKNEADLAKRLTEAQKVAAKLAPEIDKLYQILKDGEADRANESKPRWKAGYDLAMGRTLAAKVRTDGYNAMLAKAKNGLKFKNADSDTWNIRPSDEITAGSALARGAKEARMYLDRVVREHPDTPWALLAARELERPMGWTWQERHTGVNDRRRNGGGNNNNNAAP
ncbi:MAG: VWA domain-containing protein, partial [Planctomycetes bacterium]|nr:VWA domain-containing protein [Planctomycetota bacterium]